MSIPPLPDPLTGPVQARPISLPYPVLPDDYPATLSRRAAGLALVVTVVVTLFTSLLLGPVLFVALGLDGNELGTLIIVSKWFDAFVAVALLIWIVQIHKLSWRAFGIHGDAPLLQGAWGFAGLVGCYGGLVLSLPLTMLTLLVMGSPEDELQRRQEFLDALPIQSLGSTVLLLVAVAIHEEILFRGLLLGLLRRLTGSTLWALLISTVVFAALHISGQGLTGFVQIMFVGLALGCVYVFSRSLPAAMLAHFLFDLLQLQIARLLTTYAPGLPEA